MVKTRGIFRPYIESVGSEAKFEQQLKRKLTTGHKLIRMVMEADGKIVIDQYYEVQELGLTEYQ